MIIEKIPSRTVAMISYRSVKLEKGNRVNPYNIFKWWGRRFSFLSRALLAALSTSKTRDMLKCIEEPSTCWSFTWRKRILDPFMGGGTIVLEALRLGYDVIGIDINYAAKAIVEQTLRLLDRKSCLNTYSCLLKTFTKTYNELKTIWTIPRVGEIIHIYLARCPPCKAPIWISSKRRNNRVVKYLVLTEEGKLRWTNEIEANKYYDKITPTTPKIDLPKDILPKEHENYIAYAVEILREDGTRSFYSLLDMEDNISRIIRDYLKKQERMLYEKYIEYVEKYDQRIPTLKETTRLSKKGINNYSKLFTWRQYISLLKLLENTPSKCLEITSLILGDIARTCSLLAIYYQPYAKVNPGLVIKSYWTPNNPVELNPFMHRFRSNKIYSIGRGTIASKLKTINNFCQRKNLLLNQNYTILRYDSTKYIHKDEVYAIVTDPPYPGYHSYIDMSLLYNYFLSLTNKTEINLEELNSYDLSDQHDYMRFYNKFVSSVSKWKKIPKYFVLLISIPKTEYASIIPEIIRSSTSILPYKLMNIYWFIGESPGKLGRSKTRGIYVLVFKKSKKQIPINNIIENIIMDFRETKNIFMKNNIDNGINWEAEKELIDETIKLIMRTNII